MKNITNTIHILLTFTFLMLVAACNKGEDDFLYKGDMLPVTIKGYNGGTEALEVKIDTFKFNFDLPTGSFNLSEAYIFPDGRNSVKISIKEKGTGKLVLEKELNKSEGAATIRFMYMDGKVGDMPEIPAVEADKIKITYMFKPTVTGYTEPVDIVLGKYYFTPKVFEEITRIKNVKPNEFADPVTLSTFSTASQPYNGQNTSVLFLVYIYKAGTNEFYTEGTGYTWHVTSSTAPKPAASVASSKLYIFSESTVGNSIRFTKNLEL
ncbi:hypothetical protein PBAL39_15029 [Pedobacter sp. BAL39]|uniref:hypothetical protein n=1 Tax=Pedobacter sp. BAL39 TaxID=391596 RepID=UPI00015599B5|nr:hypothetical protein [Pedobacter sp. BAL39]EDM37749.1 hypothetical protein PBAL39_15029 [Pedobacter sp. BAL39]